MPWYKQLHWQIIIGLVLGLVFGIIASASGWAEFTTDWIKPFGTIFVNLLKVIAVPLILASLITGVASLSDLKKLSRIGGKTIGVYMGTTLVALIIGLVLVNVMKPGERIPPAMQQELRASYQTTMEEKTAQAEVVKERGPLQALVDMVPDNIFAASSDNRNMLQVVFFSLLFGMALIMLPGEKAQPLLTFFSSLNDLVIKLVDLIMYLAPVGVFALMADTITSVGGGDLARIGELVSALGYYCLAVILGLILQMTLTYTSLVHFFTPLGIGQFYSGIKDALLVAFSTSSSGATLPVTMEVAEKNLGVSEEVASFALPLGATINMDGTALYQAVAAVFIAQALNIDLGLGAQITIVLTALLASIGTAAVPSAGIIMLVIILESVGVPTSGIALILGVDRILDMCRTTTNVSGDLAVSSMVAASERKLAGQVPAG